MSNRRKSYYDTTNNSNCVGYEDEQTWTLLGDTDDHPRVSNKISRPEKRFKSSNVSVNDVPFAVDFSQSGGTGGGGLLQSGPILRRARDANAHQDQIGSNTYRDQANLSRGPEASRFVPSNSFQPVYHGDSHESSRLTCNPFSNSQAIDLSQINDCSKSQSDYLYYSIQPNDTLHSISVRYSCPVASIKRLNNIWSDQEFFARSRLKLPVGKFGLLSDVIGDQVDTEHNDGSKPEGSVVTNDIRDRSADEIPTKQGSCGIPDRSLYVNQGIDVFKRESEQSGIGTSNMFNNLDKIIAKGRTDALSYEAHANEIMEALVQGGNIICDDPHLVSARREAETLLNDMSDSDLSYSGLILFIFIVCLICPLAYVIYLEESHHLESNKIS